MNAAPYPTSVHSRVLHAGRHFVGLRGMFEPSSRGVRLGFKIASPKSTMTGLRQKGQRGRRVL